MCLGGPDESLFYAMVKHHWVRDLPIEQQRGLLQQELAKGSEEYRDSLLTLDTESLEKVVARAVAWRTREGPKGDSTRSLALELPLGKMVEGAKIFEKELGLDYGNYDWNSYQPRHTPGLTTGTHCVYYFAKSGEIDRLQHELTRRER